jgi:hypothetical protein
MRDWYAARTLEAHHIVEDNLIQAINLAKRDLEHLRAPAILVMAEFHRRHFTPKVAQVRGIARDAVGDKNQFVSSLQSLYVRFDGASLDPTTGTKVDPLTNRASLYRLPGAEPLAKIAQRIIDAVVNDYHPSSS